MATTSNHKRKPGKRGKASGWSPGASRRNVAFLRSVDENALDGVGLALTLTLRDCPATVAEWSALLRAWIQRQARGGMVRLHWVMEVQRRGCPHLHCAIWYADESLRTPSSKHHILASRAMQHVDMAAAKPSERQAATVAIADWIEIGEQLEAGPGGQHSRPMSEPVGWFRYLAQHCGRGRKHYQRAQENMPEAWTSSPRVWGHRGTWITEEPATATLSNRQHNILRRRVRAWRVAAVREKLPGVGWSWESRMPLLTRPQLREAPIGRGTGRRPLQKLLRDLKHAQEMLKCHDPKLSPVRGVSEWISQEQQQQLLRLL